MLLVYLNLSVLIMLEIVFRLCIGEISSFSFLIFPSGSINERKLFSLLKILTVAVLAHFPSVVSSHSGLISKGFVSERYILNSHDTKWLWKGNRGKLYMQCFYNFHAFYTSGIVPVKDRFQRFTLSMV